MEKFKLCHATLAWASKNKFITLRSKSDACKLAWKNGNQNAEKYRTPEHRKRMAKFGGLKPNAGRCKHISYLCQNGDVVDIQGTWELKFVTFMDLGNIRWERNRVGYKYIFNDKDHLYFPDFFLPELDVYVEVKGYEIERDRHKWRQFPFKLLIVKKEEIEDLPLWLKTTLSKVHTA